MTRFLLILTMLFFCASACADPRKNAIPLYSDGIRLAADLWTPEGLKPGEQRPAILMIHGWGGVKSHLNSAYAPQFTDLGYIVLTFDYTGWGESEGQVIRTGTRPEVALDSEGETYNTEVRELRMGVNPLEQMDDIRAAFAFLATEPTVDADRIAVWGSSLGGGLALAMAVEFPQIKVLMSQVGSINPRGSDQDLPDTHPFSDQNMLKWRGAIARGDITSFPTEAAPGLRGFPDWPDMQRYNPFAQVDQLSAATLIVDAADEELFDISMNGAALYARVKDRVPARYETIAGKHYDVYSGEGYEKALTWQKDWLARHLPVGR